MESKKGKILTITSMKGGVGKTTLVMMLAAIYAHNGKKTLVLDLDLYSGNLAFAYNVKVKNSIYNICDNMANNLLKNGIDADYVSEIDENLYFISAPKDPRKANKVNNKYLDNVLKLLSYSYDVILIDTDHTLSVSNMVAFENSDKIINLFTNNSFDLQGTKNFVAICKNMEVDNLVLMLNDAVSNQYDYYSMYDIKSITKSNIDYTISKNLHLKNFDQLVIDGDLKNFYKHFNGDSKKSFEEFATCMLKLIDDGGKK